MDSLHTEVSCKIPTDFSVTISGKYLIHAVKFGTPFYRARSKK